MSKLAVRYVDVTAAGIFTWLSQPVPSLQRDLVERLLWRDPGKVFDFTALAQTMHTPVPDMAKALFGMLREGTLRVDAGGPPEPVRPGFAQGLQEDARHIASDAAPLIFAGDDGQCLLHVNCEPILAACVAARMPARAGPDAKPPDAAQRIAPAATLYFNLENITVFATPSLDRRHPRWVPFARRLLRSCGALSFGRA